ncbi:MAG TPA: zf-HC2 domain-containing protein [Pyrinomonadaceae bacterium]
MNCDWAEKISLLIDGELPPQERRATEAHLESCAGCRRTKEDFLSLRSVVNSYPLAADATDERRALEKILASAAHSTRDASDAAATTVPRTSWRELLVWPRLTPALGAALAVLLLAVALGVVWSVSRRDAGQRLVAEGTGQDKARRSSNGPTQSDAPAPKASNPDASTPDAPASNAPAPGGPSEPAPKKDAPGGVNAPGRKLFNVPRAIERREDIVARHTTRTATPAGGATLESASSAAAARSESAADALAEFKPLFDVADGHAGDESALSVDAEPRGDTARHLEQAQILMRTIRNARPGDRPGAIADERRRSQQLLYRNIVLRREAARAGNAPVEHALDSLEPLLVDIANLPERASREDVSVIQERMRRKNIVAVLQANIAAVPRTYQ